MQFTAKGLLAAVLFLLTIHKNATAKQTIELKLEKASLQQAFNAISKQSGKLFLYTDDMLKDATPITINISNTTLRNALDECLKSQPYTWKEINQTIVISNKQQ